MRKKALHRLGALALTAVLALGLCAPALAADRATSVEDGEFLKGTFTFGPHVVTSDLTDTFIYSDNYFSGSSYEANEHLVTMSMQLAVSSISSEDTGDDYTTKSQNVQALLRALRFQDVEVNDDYKQPMTRYTMGAAAAYKNLDDSTVLLAIVPRSAGYKREWGGNFTIGAGNSPESDYYTTNPDGFEGTNGLHAGFQLARNIVLDFVKNYVDGRRDAFDGKTVKVWIAGYSRGAATANLVGAALVDNAPAAIGLEVDSQNIFDYTFGTPATVLPQEGNDPKAEEYNGIHNYFAEYDPVTMAPFAAWGFTRYGQEVTYNTVGNKTRMLRFLSTISPTIYNLYMTGGDPDGFSRYTLGENLELTPVAGEAITQREFLQERIGILTAKAATGRGVYVQEFQSALASLAELFFGETDETVQNFVEGVSEDKTRLTQLVLLLAFYDWAEEYAALEDARSKADQAADALKEALPEGSEYDELRETISDGEKLDAFLTGSETKSEYITQTETLVTEILTAGFDKAGMAEGNPVRTGLLDGVSGLTKFLGYTAFGTEKTLASLNDSAAIADALVEKINTAATALGNTDSYMRAHNNEVVVSWLRTMDSYYDDPVVDDGAPTYAIRTGTMEHGSVKASARAAERGDRVTLTVSPDDGYELEALTVTDGSGAALALTDNGNGKYVFTMPGSRVTVSAVFRETRLGPAYESFSDLKADAWYRDGVEYALKKGLMRGVSDSEFAPNESMSRAMAITVLWRAAGSPVVNYALSFSDVTPGSWYADAAAWAASEGIVGGYPDGRLGVGDSVTREQLALMLYRFALKTGMDVSAGENTNILSYDDAVSVSAYAVPAMQWACGSGVINGSASPGGGAVLDPQGSATRAQLATMLLRFGGAAA